MQRRVATLVGLLVLPLFVGSSLPSQVAPKGGADPEDLFAKGQELERRGELRLAMETYEAAALAFEESGDQVGLARSLTHLGGMEVLAGKRGAAREHLSQALSLIEQLEKPSLEAQALIFLGWLHHATSAFDMARESFSKAHDIAETLEDARLESRALTGLGWTEFFVGNRQPAIEFFRKAVSRAEDTEEMLLQAEGLRGLASVLGLMDDRQAFTTLKKAEQLVRKTGNRYYLAQTLHSLGNIYIAMGNYERAIRYYEETLALKRDIGDEATSGTLIGLGAAHASLGDFRSALAIYREAERVASHTSNRDHLSRIYNNLGVTYGMQQDHMRAAEAYERAAKIAEEIGSKELVILARANRALALVDLPDSTIRGEAVAEIGRIAEETGLPHLMWLAHMAQALHAQRLGNFEAAEQGYKRTLETIEGGRYQLPTPAGRARYLESKLAVYEQYVKFLYDRSRADPDGAWVKLAFEAAERAKARSLLESLAEARQGIDERLPTEIRERKEALLGTFSRLQGRLVRLGAQAPEREKLLAELRRAEDKWEDLLTEMRAAEPAYVEFGFPQPHSIGEIQEALGPDEVLLSYFLGNDYSFVLAVSREGVQVQLLPRRRVIEAAVARFRELLTAPARRAGALTDVSRESAKLYEMLLAPVRREVTGARRLRISPDGVLHYVPFEALRTGDAYVVERYEVSYIPSASALLALRRFHPEEKGTRRQTLLAVGAPVFDFARQPGGGEAKSALRDFYLERGFDLAPLPFAKVELKAIQDTFSRGSVVARTGPVAREDWLKGEELTQYRYLHFATHALADEQTPARSALVLSMPSGEGEDGLLQVREIANLKLAAELVVLSGCRTGLGRLVRGEGILGLTQSFFYAGAPSVVVSLWDVRDRATAIFMETLYRELRRGRSKGEALRLAKLSMLRSDTPAYHHPYYWAPFVLVGKWD